MLTGDILRRSAHRFPDRPAIRCGRTTMRYRELDAAANRFAHALLGLGLAMGAKVAILSRNLPEYGVVFFGAARTGFVLANVSVRYAPDELAYVLDNADAAVLVYDGSLAGQVAAVQDRLPGIGAYVAIGDPGTVRGAVRFDDFLRGAPERAPDVALDEDDPFCMTYTGGTTGRPKGVLCSHRARAATAHTVVVEEALDERDVVGIVTPLFHVAALNIMFQPAILAGATTTFLTEWDPAGFVAMVERERMTASFMVPTQAAMLLNHPCFDAGRLATWRKLSFAGAPMPDWVQKELRARLPELRLTQLYGQSEMGVVAVLRHWYLPDKLGAVGRQAYNVDTRVARPDGTDVKAGEIGEVVSRGAHLMLGYHGEPGQTREFFRRGDGWGWSGDLATVDADGFITLVDRAKDMIISGGENVYPKEIETAIHELGAVAECAVFGIPDDRWGEVPAAYVLLRSGAALDAGAVTAHCAGRLARFKRPRLVRFVEDFPRTPIGKIRKTALREPFWRGRRKRI